MNLLKIDPEKVRELFCDKCLARIDDPDDPSTETCDACTARIRRCFQQVKESQ